MITFHKIVDTYLSKWFESLLLTTLILYVWDCSGNQIYALIYDIKHAEGCI